MAVWSDTVLSSVGENYGRFDAEYYRPEFIETDRILSSIDNVKLLNIASKIDVGHVGPMVHHYSDTGVLLLQTQNVREFFLDLQHSIQVTYDFHFKLSKSQVRKGDILIARSGSFGSAAIYLEDQVINSADIIIVEIDDPRIEPLYAVTFMNTRHGSSQFIRFASGGVQGHVNLRILEHFRIPVLPDTAQSEVASIVQRAYEVLKASAGAYKKAQHLLESELGMNKLSFQKPVGYTARFSTVGLSDTFFSKRIDSQCFAPDALFYERWLLSHVRCDRLGKLLHSTAKGCQQAKSSRWNCDYCSIKHISGRELVGVSKCRLGADTSVAGTDDLLLAITGATIGKIGIVKRYTRLAFSGDLLMLRANSEINPNYLLLALGHRIGQVQFSRWITGSTNGHLAPRDIGRVLVPRLDESIEEQISQLVEKSLSKRRESEQLLDQAKTRVEQLIEEAARK